MAREPRNPHDRQRNTQSFTDQLRNTMSDAAVRFMANASNPAQRVDPWPGGDYSQIERRMAADIAAESSSTRTGRYTRGPEPATLQGRYYDDPTIRAIDRAEELRLLKALGSLMANLNNTNAVLRTQIEQAPASVNVTISFDSQEIIDEFLGNFNAVLQHYHENPTETERHETPAPPPPPQPPREPPKGERQAGRRKLRIRPYDEQDG